MKDQSTDAERGRRLRALWERIPGVIFPTFSKKEALLNGYDPETNHPYEDIPRGYVSIDKAAHMLCSGASAARVKLKMHGITYKWVRVGNKQPSRYWSLNELRALVDKTPPLATTADLVGLRPLEEMIPCIAFARSTVMRAVKSGELEVSRYRVPTEQGLQKRIYVHPDVLEAWIAMRGGK